MLANKAGASEKKGVLARRLADIKENWEKETSAFASVPEGVYVMQLQSATVKRARRLGGCKSIGSISSSRGMPRGT